jgi:glycosyltransferase involved in cell wall biosynthesis
MPDPAITVVIPALNAGKVIAETLASVCQQTFPHWEALIAIDDGSTDDSADIVRQFSQRDSRFQLIHQTERGVSAARNQAIARGKGEFIAFLDADDLWLPEKLEKQIKLFESGQRIDVAFTNFHFWDGEKDSGPFFGPHRPMPAGNLDQEIILSISRLCPTMSVQMMRKEGRGLGPVAAPGRKRALGGRRQRTFGSIPTMGGKRHQRKIEGCARQRGCTDQKSPSN